MVLWIFVFLTRTTMLIQHFVKCLHFSDTNNNICLVSTSGACRTPSGTTGSTVGGGTNRTPSGAQAQPFPRNVPSRSTFHSGQNRQRPYTGGAPSPTDSSRTSFFSKLSSRFSKRWVP